MSLIGDDYGEFDNHGSITYTTPIHPAVIAVMSFIAGCVITGIFLYVNLN